MKVTNIREKLEQLDVTVEAINLGEFDLIGEYTAKRLRDRNDPNFKRYGAFLRANYERGILIYYLIRQHNLRSMLEIGFGRGYASLCAAKAFFDAGINGRIVTIEPNVNEQHMKVLTQLFPREWFSMTTFAKGTSHDVLPTLNESFDLVYIDGDHSYEATKYDWEMTRDKFNRFMLFDDYHMPSKNDPGIKCRDLIDQIDELSVGCEEKELLVLDRRLFYDDRGLSDAEVDYGQILLTRSQ